MGLLTDTFIRVEEKMCISGNLDVRGSTMVLDDYPGNFFFSVLHRLVCLGTLSSVRLVGYGPVSVWGLDNVSCILGAKLHTSGSVDSWIILQEKAW